MAEGESKVKQVLSILWSYLYSSLPPTEDFIIQLEIGGLIARNDATKLRASARLGSTSCIHDLITYMYQFFDEPAFETFCTILDKYGRSARPLLLEVAARIREEIGLKPPQVHEPAPEDPQKGTSKPRADVGDDTSRSADMSQHDVYYPVIDDLKPSFSNLAGNVLSTIDLLSSKNLKAFCTNFLLNHLKPSFPPDAPLPVIPKTVEDLKPFLASRWDPLQIDLLKAVVERLASRKIQGGNFKATVKKVKYELNAYEDLLKRKLPEFLSECRSESVSLKSYPGQSSVSAKIASTPAEISLSRIMKLRGFFIRDLDFRYTLFTGFSEGCIVLFFSIPTECVWNLPSCLHPSNLSQLEEWKVLFLSVEGAFTVDIKERRVIDSLDKEKDTQRQKEYTLLREVATQVQEDDTVLLEVPTQVQEDDTLLQVKDAQHAADLGNLHLPVEETGTPLQHVSRQCLALVDYSHLKRKGTELTLPAGEAKGQPVDYSTAQAVTMEEGESKVKQVLSILWSYLYSSLPPNEDFIIQLEIGGIIARNDATRLRASARLGGRACIQDLITFMYDFFDEPALEAFCTFLDKYGQPTRTPMLEVAAKIREEIGLKLKPVHEPAPEDPQKGTSKPRADVDDVYYPVIDDLKISFSNLASNVLSIIGSLSSKRLKPFCSFLSNYLKPSFPPDAPLPVIPVTFQDLNPFLTERWDPLQIALLKAVVKSLTLRKIEAPNFRQKVRIVKDELDGYEYLLKSKLPEFLSKCRSESVFLKSYPGKSSVSVKIDSNPEEISLARIIKLKGFFIDQLGLPDTKFTGFSEGSIVFFSIPTECVWNLPFCLRPSNLSLLEEWKVLFLSVKGAFTVDIKERRARVFDHRSLDKDPNVVQLPNLEGGLQLIGTRHEVDSGVML